MSIPTIKKTIKGLTLQENFHLNPLKTWYKTLHTKREDTFKTPNSRCLMMPFSIQTLHPFTHVTFVDILDTVKAIGYVYQDNVDLFTGMDLRDCSQRRLAGHQSITALRVDIDRLRRDRSFL